VTGIVEFLAARLNEREQLARAVEHAVGDQYDALMAGLGDTYQLGIVSLYWRSHDPARVLAEVAAKRRVMERHHADDDGSCVGCGFYNDETRRVEDINECPELRDLAAPHDQSPDYDPAWRVA
jgi:hypothetical protein